MKKTEIMQFYDNQFHLFKEEVDLTTRDTQLANEIIEQIGVPFQSVFELGAGNGLLARSLAAFDKTITTVELIPDMVTFAQQFDHPNITSLCGDFYTIELPKTFDTILYIDGFGVGTDEEQLLLLHRIRKWLKADGVALIDIYHPNYWRKTSGQTMHPFPSEHISRVYGFDEESNRMTDTWWNEEHPEKTYTQSLACYLPDEIYALCKQAQLQIVAYYPGGAMDFEQWQYQEQVALSECLSYRIKLKKR
ncbi:MAG TPA: class I SAM-dependent methyltransferase [Sporosarcina sp.]|nr:class I SAM-dependent methyltransferase [Sporosarcina sp.]